MDSAGPWAPIGSAGAAYAAMPGGGADGRPFAEAIGAAGLTCGTGVGSGSGDDEDDATSTRTTTRTRTRSRR